MQQPAGLGHRVVPVIVLSMLLVSLYDLTSAWTAILWRRIARYRQIGHRAAALGQVERHAADRLRYRIGRTADRQAIDRQCRVLCANGLGEILRGGRIVGQQAGDRGIAAAG